MKWWARAPRRWVVGLVVVTVIGGFLVTLSSLHRAVAASGGGAYTPVTPLRLMDTRSPGAGGPLGPGGSRTLPVALPGRVPSSAVSAVVLNVTVTQPTAPGWVLVYSGSTRPGTSNVDFTAGQTIANQVIVPLMGGSVTFYNGSAGTVQLVVDLQGWFSAGSPGPGDFTPLTAARLLDTRSAGGGGPVAAGGTRTLPVALPGGVSPSAVSAVVLNVTVTQPMAPGWVVAYSGSARPGTSNVNFAPGQTVANLVLVPLSGGSVTFYNGSAGSVHLVVDVEGWFTAGSPGPGGLTPVTAVRLLDTRSPGGGGAVGAGATRTFPVALPGGVSSSAVGAVVLNVTVTQPTAPGWVVAYSGGARPGTSNVNFATGQTIAGLVVVPLSGGSVTFYNGSAGSVQLVVDMEGWFTASAAPPSPSVLLGDTNVEGTPDSSSGSWVEAFGYTAGQSGTAASISAYLTSTDGAHVALYSDSSLTPASLLDQASVPTNPVGWVTIPLLGAVQITSGTRYWIALGSTGGSASVSYRDAGSSGSNLDFSSGAGFTSPYQPNGEWNSNPMSAYVSGIATAGTTTTTAPPTTPTTVPQSTTTTVASGGGGSGPPTGPPVRVCGNTSLLSGPSSPPSGAVVVPAGDNFNQLGLNYNLAPNTTYYLAAGVHTLETGQYNQIQPQNGDTFIGAPGAILDGQNSNEYAFTQHASNVKIEYLTIRNFVTPFNEGAVNHDSGTGWTISHDTITNIGNTAAGGQSGAAIIGGVNETVTWDCLSYDGQYGINGAGVPAAVGPGAQYTNMDIENNEFSHDAPNGDSVGGTSGAFKLWYDSDVTVKANWVNDSGTVGMWADTNNDGVVIEGNYVDHNANEALIYEISYNALIENNTFVDNGWKAGPGNPGFPTGAIYVFSSGGDSRVPNGFGITTLTISGNVFTDNWGGVVLYQNGDRICGFSDSGNCTLINPSTYTESSCRANIAEISPVDYFDNCIWKTQNVSVTANQFTYHQATIGAACTAANTCGYSALFGTYSAEPGHTGARIPLAVSNQQNNQFSGNTYQGGLGFTAFNQGDNVGWTQWSRGFTDGSSGDQFSPQDANSTFS